MSKQPVSSTSQRDFDLWARRLLFLFMDKIEQVGLVGAGSTQKPSDWDVVICLRDKCYANGRGDELERKITFHPEIKNKNIEVFFVTPDNTLKRWGVTESGEKYLDICFDYSIPKKDFLKFWGKLPGKFRRQYPGLEI